MRTEVDPNNLLNYTIDGHVFGMQPLTSILNDEVRCEYEGAVEENIYLMERLLLEERRIKKRMNRIYFELVHLDFLLEKAEDKLNRIELLKTTLFYPALRATKSNARVCGKG